MAGSFHGQRVLITGGTGSLGGALLRRLLAGSLGDCERVVVLSRDEAKQHAMRLEFLSAPTATDEIIYRASPRRLEFRIGDVRDLATMEAAIDGIDVVVHAAALKQVPNCEYFPEEAVRTNIGGASNLVEAVRRARRRPQAVIAISTDKAVKPVNAMGMTKALQERIITRAALAVDDCRFAVIRYGNVIASRGSVVPLFLDQIRGNGPVTITDPAMTRFLATLDDAVDAIAAACRDAVSGETFVPLLPAALVVDIARALIGERPIEMRTTGIRPGEKLHEVLISEEELRRCGRRGDCYVIAPLLPELRTGPSGLPPLDAEYSSEDITVGVEEIRRILRGCNIPVPVAGEAASLVAAGRPRA